MKQKKARNHKVWSRKITSAGDHQTFAKDLTFFKEV